MAYFYVDTDGSGASAPYGTWATAGQDLVTVAAAMSAGDICFMQGAAADTTATARTLTFPTTKTNPVMVIGVKDGTTNEGASVVTSDLAIRGTDTLPLFQNTGAGNDITISSGSVVNFAGIEVDCIDRFQSTAATWVDFIGCKVKFTGQHRNIAGLWRHYNCEIAYNASGANMLTRGNNEFYGGEFTFNGTVADLFGIGALALYNLLLKGVDLSAWASGQTILNVGAATTMRALLSNCSMPSTFSLTDATITDSYANITLIGCSDTSSQAADSSIQDYQYEDAYGTIDLESTAVRTGGADDGASGGFSYALTAFASLTLESSQATLKSPWMTTWIPAGSQTLTVYIANDGAGDYNEDEVWCEFYTPDSGDTAQHEQTFDPAGARLLTSSTAVTDDTGSTWGTGANNHQKLEVTVVPGFEGWAYARLHLAKRQATPDTLFLDPKIAVT